MEVERERQGDIDHRCVLTHECKKLANNKMSEDYFIVKVKRRTLSVHTVGGRRYMVSRVPATLVRTCVRTKVKWRTKDGHHSAARPRSPDGDTMRRGLEGCGVKNDGHRR